MLQRYFRTLYQYIFVDPIARILAPLLPPNRITLVACLTGIAVIPCLVSGLTNLACFLILVSGYLDTLDGTMARFLCNVTPKGTVLDIICDRIVEFAIIFGLFLVDPQRGWLIILMLGSCFVCITSFLVVGIVTPNESPKGFYYSPGLIERAEAFAFFILMIQLPEYFNVIGILFTLLVFVSTYLHIRQFINT